MFLLTKDTFRHEKDEKDNGKHPENKHDPKAENTETKNTTWTNNTDNERRQQM